MFLICSYLPEPYPNATRLLGTIPSSALLWWRLLHKTENVLVVRPFSRLTNEWMATLQYALKRGIEATFQLEEAELAAEPLPSKDDRKTILFYESAEGGAGVLTRLANDPAAMSRVAVKALEIATGGPGRATGPGSRI